MISPPRGPRFPAPAVRFPGAPLGNSPLPGLLRFGLLGFLGFLLAGCSGSGYRLLGDYDYPEGTVLHDEASMTLDEAALQLEVLGQTIPGRATWHTVMVYDVEILSSTRSRLVFQADAERNVLEIMEEEHRDESRSPLEGVPLIGVEQEGVIRFSLETGEPTPQQQEKLEEIADMFNSEPDFYPEKKVKVGDSWQVDPEIVTSWMGDDLIEADGEVMMELLEITEWQGLECAHLFVTVKVKGKYLDEDDSVLRIGLSLEGDVYRSLEYFEDTYAELRGHSMFEGTIIEEGQAMAMTLTGPMILLEKKTIE